MVTLYETPQFMYLVDCSNHLLQSIPKKHVSITLRSTMTQSQNTKSTFPHLSWRECELHLRQYASCVLVDVDDSLDSIFSSDMAIGRYVAQRAGIGINAGRIRGINS